jgi:hypothetical protein
MIMQGFLLILVIRLIPDFNAGRKLAYEQWLRCFSHWRKSVIFITMKGCKTSDICFPNPTWFAIIKKYPHVISTHLRQVPSTG